MITGAHAIIYSKNADADREFFQKIIRLTHVDVGGGWLIFGLPPSEIAIHPADSSSHALYLMCDNITDFVAKMSKEGIKCSAIQNQGWGLLTELKLPGGGKLGVYEPRHARPKPMIVKKAAAKKKVKTTAAKKTSVTKRKIKK